MLENNIIQRHFHNLNVLGLSLVVASVNIRPLCTEQGQVFREGVTTVFNRSECVACAFGNKACVFLSLLYKVLFPPASFGLSLIWVKGQPSTNYKKSQRSSLKDDLHCCSLCLGEVCVCDWLSRSLSKRERGSSDISFSCLLVY